jgi:hypothetical protein
MRAYYYASGQKVELEPDDEHVALDRTAAAKTGRAEPATSTRSASAPAGVIVVERKAIDDDTLAKLRKEGAVQTVYRRNRALVVPLPEVRIEFDRPDQRRAVLDVLSTIGTPYKIAEDTDDRLVVAPASGRGDDALRLANEVYERAHPAAASVRFFQIVPKPSLRS